MVEPATARAFSLEVQISYLELGKRADPTMLKVGNTMG
jgi:hypothetical protein